MCQKLCRKIGEQKTKDLLTVRGYEVAHFMHYRSDMFRLFKMRERKSDPLILQVKLSI